MQHDTWNRGTHAHIILLSPLALFCTITVSCWTANKKETQFKCCTHRLLVVQAINIMSLGVDFEITQVVDSNVGIHSKIPK